MQTPQQTVDKAKSEKKDNEDSKKDDVNSHTPFQKHIAGGEYIKSAVYGGLDGLCTTAIIALSGIGSVTGASVIVALGVASLIADGLSMAIADFFATKSDDDYMKTEERRQRQEITESFQTEKQEMVSLYTEMGLEPAVSEEIVSILSTNKEGFLQVMMIEELQLIADEQNPIRNGIVTFFSFGVFGILPLIPFFIAKSYDLTVDKYIIFPSIGVAIGGLILLGILKSCVTIQSWYTSVLETLIVGGLSAGTSYGVGKAFE